MITGPNESVLFFQDLIDPSEPSGLWWCQNVFDVECVQKGEPHFNAASLLLNGDWTDLNGWGGWLSQFPYILVAIAPGPEQDRAVEALSLRSPVPVLVPNPNAFYGAGSMRELCENVGRRAMENLLLEAEEMPVPGLLNFAGINIHAKQQIKRVTSGIPGLDRAVRGFAPGELSVWTGKRGEGKSTLMGQILLEAVNQNHVVCAYSGELPAEQFKTGLQQQAAGYLYVSQFEDPWSGGMVYQVKPEAEAEIDSWADGRLFLTDIAMENAHDEDNILKLFRYANRRYGADVFLVDNIMTAQLRDEAKLGFWRAQSNFTGRLMDFARNNSVHVHLVAHPKKVGNGPIEADDVAGSGDITNRANNVFKVERVPEDKVQAAGYSTLLTVMKNREFGARDRIKLDFNQPSRRLYPAGGSPAKQYSWEMKMRHGQ